MTDEQDDPSGSKMIRILASMLLLLGATGCAARSGPASPEVPLGSQFKLKAASSAVVSGQDLRVTFDGVVADSRCATDVQCVWEGDATVKVTLSRPTLPPASVELHTHTGSPPPPAASQEARYGDHRIRLVSLEPLPRSDSRIPPGDYVATLLVARN